MKVSEETLVNLEYNKILNRIAEQTNSARTKELILNIKPKAVFNDFTFDLKCTNEYLSSFLNENKIPYSPHFYLGDSLKRMTIENYALPADDFLKIKSNALQIKELTRFLEKFIEYFPTIHTKSGSVVYKKEIVKHIDEVFNKHGEIKDNATQDLKAIRRGIKNLSGRIMKQFNDSLQRNAQYLDEIRESVVDNIRVLAVNSTVRKRVKGRFLGTSKTGSISFIQPESVVQTQRELEELKEEEKKEIRKILINLTANLAEYKPEITKYEAFLEFLDFTQAKAKYANEISAVLPELSQESELELKQAYHPVLFLQNQQKQHQTIPQDIKLNRNQRMIVISGPNAGGKSITLKTVGLLQIMIQSGILIPVHPKSKVGVFNQILTDIGDNQSIENQLSTYSYRLKQMSFFLRNTKEKTLLLIDEFGTGSDPELGGALAEVFFEEFYQLNCFGIFTTHYTNIKLKAEELTEALNACMLFNEKTLEPLYKLELGQAGSSFTFEVAEKNRIPYRLINRAKKKIERDKVRLDKTILKLQQEKFDLQKTKNEISTIRDESEVEKKKIVNTEEKIQQKLVQFQQLYDVENKTLSVGKKVQELSNNYLKSKNKKQLIGQFLKLIEMENAKKTEHFQKQQKVQKKIEKIVQRELKENKESIRKEQKKFIEKQKKEQKQRIESFKVGDRVKIKDSNSVGTIEMIENETISINYGTFRAKVSIFETERI